MLGVQYELESSLSRSHHALCWCPPLNSIVCCGGAPPLEDVERFLAARRRLRRQVEEEEGGQPREAQQREDEDAGQEERGRGGAAAPRGSSRNSSRESDDSASRARAAVNGAGVGGEEEEEAAAVPLQNRILWCLPLDSLVDGVRHFVQEEVLSKPFDEMALARITAAVLTKEAEKRSSWYAQQSSPPHEAHCTPTTKNNKETNPRNDPSITPIDNTKREKNTELGHRLPEGGRRRRPRCELEGEGEDEEDDEVGEDEEVRVKGAVDELHVLVGAEQRDDKPVSMSSRVISSLAGIPSTNINTGITNSTSTKTSSPTESAHSTPQQWPPSPSPALSHPHPLCATDEASAVAVAAAGESIGQPYETARRRDNPISGRAGGQSLDGGTIAAAALGVVSGDSTPVLQVIEKREESPLPLALSLLPPSTAAAAAGPLSRGLGVPDPTTTTETLPPLATTPPQRRRRRGEPSGQFTSSSPPGVRTQEESGRNTTTMTTNTIKANHQDGRSAGAGPILCPSGNPLMHSCSLAPSLSASSSSSSFSVGAVGAAGGEGKGSALGVRPDAVGRQHTSDASTTVAAVPLSHQTPPIGSVWAARVEASGYSFNPTNQQWSRPPPAPALPPTASSAPPSHSTTSASVSHTHNPTSVNALSGFRNRPAAHDSPHTIHSIPTDENRMQGEKGKPPILEWLPICSSTGTPDPRPRFGHHVFYFEDRLYMIGGMYMDAPALAQVDLCFDLQLREWRRLSPPLFPPRFHGALALSHLPEALEVSPDVLYCWRRTVEMNEAEDEEEDVEGNRNGQERGGGRGSRGLPQGTSSVSFFPQARNHRRNQRLSSSASASAASSLHEGGASPSLGISLFLFGGVDDMQRETNTLFAVSLPGNNCEPLPQLGAVPPPQYQGSLVADVSAASTVLDTSIGAHVYQGRLFYLDGYQRGRAMVGSLRVYDMASGFWRRICPCPNLLGGRIAGLRYVRVTAEEAAAREERRRRNGALASSSSSSSSPPSSSLSSSSSSSSSCGVAVEREGGGDSSSPHRRATRHKKAKTATRHHQHERSHRPYMARPRSTMSPLRGGGRIPGLAAVPPGSAVLSSPVTSGVSPAGGGDGAQPRHHPDPRVVIGAGEVQQPDDGTRLSSPSPTSSSSSSLSTSPTSLSLAPTVVTMADPNDSAIIHRAAVTLTVLPTTSNMVATVPFPSRPLTMTDSPDHQRRRRRPPPPPPPPHNTATDSSLMATGRSPSLVHRPQWQLERFDVFGGLPPRPQEHGSSSSQPQQQLQQTHSNTSPVSPSGSPLFFPGGPCCLTFSFDVESETFGLPHVIPDVPRPFHHAVTPLPGAVALQLETAMWQTQHALERAIRREQAKARQEDSGYEREEEEGQQSVGCRTWWCGEPDGPAVSRVTAVHPRQEIVTPPGRETSASSQRGRGRGTTALVVPQLVASNRLPLQRVWTDLLERRLRLEDEELDVVENEQDDGHDHDEEEEEEERRREQGEGEEAISLSRTATYGRTTLPSLGATTLSTSPFLNAMSMPIAPSPSAPASLSLPPSGRSDGHHERNSPPGNTRNPHEQDGNTEGTRIRQIQRPRDTTTTALTGPSSFTAPSSSAPRELFFSSIAFGGASLSRDATSTIFLLGPRRIPLAEALRNWMKQHHLPYHLPLPSTAMEGQAGAATGEWGQVVIDETLDALF